MKTSMAHNKYLKTQFLEDSNLISAKYSAQILSLNLAYTFLLLIFLITGLRNSLHLNLYTILTNPI